LVQYGFDGQGRLLAERDAGGSQTAYTYNSANNRTSMRLPSDALWQYAYDARGNQTQATDPRGKTTQRTFDAGDRVLTVTDPLGNVTLYDYDMRGNLIRETDPTGAATQHAYNADGSLAQTTDPAGKVTAFAYNANGHLIRVTDPLGNQSNYVWQNTRLVQRTDARGRTTSYIYDAWGRQVGVDYPAGGSADIALTLDPEGRLVQSVDGTGTRTWTYDTWGRPLTQTSPAGNTSASYDAAGRLLTQTDVTGRQIQYAYNAAKRISLVGDNVGIALYTYTADGLPTVETYPNGTQVIRNYDAAGRLTSLTHRRTSDGSTIIGYTAEYDDAGRLTQVIEQPSGDVTTFAYDAAGRLLSETRAGVRSYTGIYSYDSRGLRTFARRTEGGVLSHEGTYTYDDAGRLTQVVDAATQQTELYSWYADGTLAAYPGPGYTRLLDYDEEGRLLRIRRDHGGGNVQTAYEYAYGHDGKRRWRKDYLTNTWTRYPCGVACGAGDLVEQQSTLAGGTWQTSALCLQGLSLVRRNGEYHHFDVLGTVGVVTDAGGTVLSSDLFDAFGVLRHSQGQAATPWRFHLECEEALIQTGVSAYRAKHALYLQQQKPKRDCAAERQSCESAAGTLLMFWTTLATAAYGAATSSCLTFFSKNWSLKKLCLFAASVAYGAAMKLAWDNYTKAMRTCQRLYEECIRLKGVP
jgi:YD repeat-containing protein